MTATIDPIALELHRAAGAVLDLECIPEGWEPEFSRLSKAFAAFPPYAEGFKAVPWDQLPQALADEYTVPALLLPVTTSGEQWRANLAIRLAAQRLGTCIGAMELTDEGLADLCVSYVLCIGEDAELEEFGVDGPEFMPVLGDVLANLTRAADQWMDIGDLQQVRTILYWIRCMSIATQYTAVLFEEQHARDFDELHGEN